MVRPGSAIIALAALAIYLMLCPPVSGVGDSSEITLVLATNGVAHPTGYPLYTLLGHFFCVLLHGLGLTWSFTANAWSAVGAAVALYFLHALAVELIGSGRGIGPGTRIVSALLPVTLFAFQPILLHEAIAAEVNAWSTAWACGTAYAFVRLIGGVATGGMHSVHRLGRSAALWGLLCGIGLAHHASSILVAAPLSLGLIAALGRQRRLSPTLVAAAAGAALLPLASYGIIAWRAWHPALIQWPTLGPTMPSVLSHITGEQYRFFLGYFAPAADQRELLARSGYPLLLPGLALLLLGGLRTGAWERRIAWWALLAAALLVTGFTFRYGVPDPAPYFLPAIALGVAAAAPAIAAVAGARPLRRWISAVAATISVLATLWLVVPRIRDGMTERRELIRYDALIHSMWSSIPADTAIVFWRDDRYYRLREYQILRGEKPALYIATPDILLEDRPREMFRTRFGIDPLSGIDVPHIEPGSAQETDLQRRFLRLLVRNVNERTRIPVIEFDPAVPIVRKLYKPWERAGEGGD